MFVYLHVYVSYYVEWAYEFKIKDIIFMLKELNVSEYVSMGE